MKTKYLIIGLIVAVSAIVYANSFRNAFVYDDVPFVSDNHFIRDFKQLPGLLTPRYFDLSKERTYRPVCTLSFFVDYALWELNVFGWHLTNFMLHTGNAILVFLIALILFKDRIIASVAGLLFAVHPVQAEAVLGISFREDLLSLFFYLLAFYLYIIVSGWIKREGKNRFLVYLLSIMSYALAVYSKEMAVTLPLVLVLYDVCFNRKQDRKEFISRAGKYYPGYLLVVVSFIVLKFTVMKNVSMPAQYPGGNIVTAMLTMTGVVVYYIRLLLYPVVLNVDYVYSASTTILDPVVLFSTAVIACLLFAAYRSYKGSRMIFFAIMFFFINLIPVSNIIPFGAILAERYLYFSSVGYFMLAGVAVRGIYNKSGAGAARVNNRKGIVTALFLCVLVLYSARTARRNIDWKDGFTLWNGTLRASPESYTAHNNLGVAYKKMGRIDDAIREYKKTIELNPTFVRAINNIGYIYYERKQYGLAIEEYRKALEINPEFAEGSLNLGLAYYAKGMYNKAIEAYNRAIDINYTKYRAYSNLIAAYARVGKFDKAIDAFNRGVKVYPDHADMHKNAGLVYKMMKDDMQALIYWKKYLRLYPDAPDAGLIKNEILKMSGK